MKSEKSKFNSILLTAFVCLFLSLVFCHPAHAEDPQPIFQESFESLESIQASGGTYSGIAIENGKQGNGVSIEGTDNLSFPAAGNFSFQKGTIEFWVKPNWDGNTGGYKSFFSIVRDPSVPAKDFLAYSN